MEIKHNEKLKKYTTIKIGGVAENFYIPANQNELIDLIKGLDNENYYILSGGSNILINDNNILKNVIYMRDALNELYLLDENCIYCGASVRIQNLINFAKKEHLGGIEYLYSLPAMLGGIIYMNAGRGRECNCSISDHIIEVKVLYENKEILLKKDQCEFSYRNSIFHTGKYVILGAKLKLDFDSVKNIDKRIKERIELCKMCQDHSGATFGSVFSQCDPFIMSLFQLSGKISHSRVHWSGIRGNWLINDGNGTFNDILKQVEKCEKVHKILGKEIKKEVLIWE